MEITVWLSFVMVTTVLPLISLLAPVDALGLATAALRRAGLTGP